MSKWRESILIENLFIQELHSASVKGREDISELNEDIVANNRSYRTRGVRSGRFKYFKYYEHNPPIEELYDLENDPSEQYNLIDKPEHAATVENLRAEMDAMQQDTTKDNRP